MPVLTKKKKTTKFLKFNLALDPGLEEIMQTIDRRFPEFRFNSSAKVRFALGQLARQTADDGWGWFDEYYNSLKPLNDEEMKKSEEEFIETWSQIKKDL